MESYYLFGVTSWGCCRGKFNLGDKTYEVMLKDGTLNGLFNDYAGDMHQTGDALTFSVLNAEGIAGASSGFVRTASRREEVAGS